jgi:flagellar biosynthetic protein FliO|tara:strand:+ start:1318 stop:1608 length:291 start_codon:yes stop_codon:yes gene_type:complete
MDFYGATRVIVSLLVVFLLLLSFLYYLKKVKGFGVPSGSDGIKILEQTYLDSNKRLVLVEVRGKNTLIGITGDKIEHLWTSNSSELDLGEGRRHEA